MSKAARPGTWVGSVLAIDNIPVICPECGQEVSLRGSLSEDEQNFQVTPCPHCGAKMELLIMAEGDEEEEVREVSPMEKIEVSLEIKGLPGLSECLYRMSGMTSVSTIIDRAVNVIATIFANQSMNPNQIKDMYVKEVISMFYTSDGKREIIKELETQIEAEARGN